MNYKSKTFSNNDLGGNDFDSQIFESCKFIGDIKFVNFNNCKFIDCDLSEALFNIASFTNCIFSGSKLSNIDFSDIRIKDCNFSDAVMENCIFQKILVKNEIKKLDLRGCTFDNTYLKNSAFIFCDLEKVNFEGSELTSVVFERSNLKETNLNRCKIDGIGFENCNIDKTVLDISGFISYGNSKGFVISS